MTTSDPTRGDSPWPPPPSPTSPAPPPPPPSGAAEDRPGPSVEDRQLLATPTRQAPIAVVFIAARFVRNLGVVNLVVAAVVLASGRIPTALFGVGLVACVAGLVFMVLAWWRFVFTVDGGELVVAKGVLAQERLTIPLDRIQSVSIDQRFLHRLIGLVSVSVDTAGSADAELQIDAVDRRRAEALQRLAAGEAKLAGLAPPGAAHGDVGAHGANGGPGGPGALGASAPQANQTVQEETLASRDAGQLLRIGLARWPWAGLAALAPMLAFANEFGDFVPFGVDRERLIDDNLSGQLGRQLVVTVAALVLAALILGTVLGLVLQVIRVVITEWDLRLIRTSTGFRRTAGLFSTTSRASTLPRIQAVRTDETPMQRALGIRQLSLPTIGPGDLIIPGATEVELRRIRDEVFGGTPEPPLDRRISPLWVFVNARNRALVALGLTVPAVLTIGWWGLLMTLGAIPGWLAARRQWRLRRWGIAADRIIENLEFVNRRTTEVELVKAQTVELSRSFFEQRRGLATVRINTAEGDLAVPFLPLAEARALRDLVLHRVESDRRAWM